MYECIVTAPAKNKQTKTPNNNNKTPPKQTNKKTVEMTDEAFMRFENTLMPCQLQAGELKKLQGWECCKERLST